MLVSFMLSVENKPFMPSFVILNAIMLSIVAPICIASNLKLKTQLKQLLGCPPIRSNSVL
jgi:hypothetical protein